MDRDALARAILAACITAVLLAPGLLLSRGALSAPVAQTPRPDEYLPLVINNLAPEYLTATAQAATRTATITATTTGTTTTATKTATTTGTTTATATRTATATGTTTAGSPTATATATATPTITPSPTSDALATAQLQIGNLTGFSFTFTLEGPTNASGEIQANQSWLVSIRPGHYTLTTYTFCRTNTVQFDIASGENRQFVYPCP